MNSAPRRWTYLRALGYEEVAPQTTNTPVKEPQASRFCAECLLGEPRPTSCCGCTTSSPAS
jgi:hypothetical protein